MEIDWVVYVKHIVFYSCSYKLRKHYLLLIRDRMLCINSKSNLLDYC